MQAVELWSMKNVVHGTQEYHCKIIRLEAEAIARDKLSAQADDKNRTPVLAGKQEELGWEEHQPAASTQAPPLGWLPHLFQCSSSTHQARLDVFSKPSDCVSFCVCVCVCVCYGGRWIKTNLNFSGSIPNNTSGRFL